MSETQVEPHFDGDRDPLRRRGRRPAKASLLAGAAALLFPIEWDEPFGLVMVEALAAGTPVIGFRRASVPEVVDHGETGFVVDDVDGMVRAIGQLGRHRPRALPARRRGRFGAGRMVDDVEDRLRDAIDLGPTGAILGPEASRVG